MIAELPFDDGATQVECGIRVQHDDGEEVLYRLILSAPEITPHSSTKQPNAQVIPPQTNPAMALPACSNTSSSRLLFIHS